MCLRRCLCIIIILIIFSYSLPAQRTIIYCGKLIDTKSIEVLSEMAIIVEGKTITDIQKGYMISMGMEVLGFRL